jgi:CheY-like chemotaxis protein
VFLNILINAAQAIEEGRTSENWISVATGREAEKVYVEIANSGAPIPPEHLPRIFDPFFTTKAQGEGIGLGLTISYAIVQQHGGRIDVQSSPDTGTRFRIWLPVEPGAAERPELDAGRVRGRVLVVDDEPAILRAMDRILSRVHRVETAGGGEEALARIEADAGFDVVFCDLMMPGMSGMDLFEQVLEKHPDLAARFVFMTGGTFTDQAQEFADRTANVRLDKPVEARDMLAVVGEMLQKQS